MLAVRTALPAPTCTTWRPATSVIARSTVARRPRRAAVTAARTARSRLREDVAVVLLPAVLAALEGEPPDDVAPAWAGRTVSRADTPGNGTAPPLRTTATAGAARATSTATPPTTSALLGLRRG